MSTGARTDLAMARIQTTLELVELGEALLRQRLRRDQPEWTDAHIDAAVREWYERQRGPELGTATGRPREIAAP